MTRFEPITLDAMASVELMNRKDTKYFFSRYKLERILEEFMPDYYVLDIQGVRGFRYNNIYFDTNDFYFYNQHHNKRTNRYKVRIRQYVESNLCFLEIKYKTNTNRTIKSRITIPEFNPHLTEESLHFIRTHVPVLREDLHPSLSVGFNRITLVNKNMRERATIDMDLFLEVPGSTQHFSNLCIAELKMDGSSSGSTFKAVMREMLCPEMRISKYSVGAAFMYSHLKQNNFKLKKLLINKIEHVPNSTI